MTLIRRIALCALVFAFAYSASLFAQSAVHSSSADSYRAPAAAVKETGYIGVQLSVRSTDFALVIDHVLRGSKAELGGLQSGDVIMKIEGADVHSNCDLYRAINGKGPGDEILVRVDRNGEPTDVRIILATASEITPVTQPASTLPSTNKSYTSACERLEKEFYNNPLMGVYVNSTGSAVLSGTIPNTGAVRAELAAGDIIEQIDGTVIPSFAELKSTISTHVPGDRVNVSFRRNGVLQTVDVVLNSYADVNPDVVAKLKEECSKSTVKFIAGERLNKVEIDPTTLSLAPNPSTGLVNIVLSGLEAQELSIRITDIIGNEFMNRRFQNVSTSLSTPVDLSDAPKGVYVVTVRQGNKSYQEKLIVE